MQVYISRVYEYGFQNTEFDAKEIPKLFYLIYLIKNIVKYYYNVNNTLL